MKEIKSYPGGIKVCKKCGRELPATTEYFYKKKSKAKYPKYKYLLRNKCKKCCDEETKRAMEKHRRKIDKKKKDVVYFIFFEELRVVKIGYTNNIQNRFKNLRVAIPGNLEILGVISGDTVLEKKLHRAFRKYKMRGEWFFYSQELKNYIEEHAEKVTVESKKPTKKKNKKKLPRWAKDIDAIRKRMEQGKLEFEARMEKLR